LQDGIFVLVLWVLPGGRDTLQMCLKKDLGFMSPLSFFVTEQVNV